MAGGKAKIKAVYADGTFADGAADVYLDIQLDNGQIIVFSLKDKDGDPEFTEILSGRHDGHPLTDGKTIYWSNGARISLEEVVAALRSGRPAAKRFKKWRAAFVSVGVAAVAAAFVLTGFLIARQPGAGPVQLDVPPVPFAMVDIELGVAFPGIGGVTVPAGATDVEILLVNPESSAYNAVFEIVVVGELLFSSGLLPPGGYFESLALQRPLTQGEHEAILNIRSYDAVTRAAMGSANVEFIIIAD